MTPLTFPVRFLAMALGAGLGVWAGPASAQAAAAAGGKPAVVTAGQACPALLQQSFNRLQDEKPQDLCQYAGKVLLEALHAKYASKGLVVLGFPSNDFGQQEPGDNKQIADFCYNTYGVKFPMFAKTSVVGAQVNPLYSALAKATGKAPKWNFHKYLIDTKGQPVASYVSSTKPSDPALVDAIERALNLR